VADQRLMPKMQAVESSDAHHAALRANLLALDVPEQLAHGRKYNVSRPAPAERSGFPQVLRAQPGQQQASTVGGSPGSDGHHEPGQAL
jgi:hypothetical protein